MQAIDKHVQLQVSKKYIQAFLVPMGVTIESIGVYYSEFSLALFCVHQ